MDASTVAAKNAGRAVVTNGASGQDREVSVYQFFYRRLPIERGRLLEILIGDGARTRAVARHRNFFTRPGLPEEFSRSITF